MKNRVRWAVSFLFIAGLIILWAGRDTAAFDPAEPFNGLAHIDGPLSLNVTISPPIAAPGDTLILSVNLRNEMKVTASPSVALRLPPGLRADTTVLPAGMTVNLQTNALNWLPILPANGGQQQIDLPLRVESADLTQPERIITAVLRYEEAEQTADASIWIGLPPQINQIRPLPPVAVGQPVQLIADTSGPGPISQSWQLGDGRRVDVADPIVSFAAAGDYIITVSAHNPLTAVRGAPVTSSNVIAIVPQPAAQFVPDDDALSVGQLVALRNYSGGQPPLIYRWDFGDGTIATDPAPSHQYAAPGVYTVHLTVENGFGQSEAFWTMTVGAPPVADMEVADSAPAGEPIMGQAYGDDTVVVYQWDMGDGAALEGESISHIYRRGGDFYVSMIAYNEYGGTEIGHWVHIDAGQTAVYLPLILRLGETANPLDPYDLVLDPVDLAEPFVMGAMELPAGLSPAEQLFLYINEARSQFDLPPLTYTSQLAAAAQLHTTDMAAFRYTAHKGSDGSLPAERLLQANYAHGYAGEATAWGFEHPYQAVEFWVNSPAHRRIILNRYATDVGVGFTVDYNAPNVWYWTAEFGNAYSAAAQPFVRLNGPKPELALMISEATTFSWNWPLPLEPGQQFTVYRLQDSKRVPLGQVAQPQLNTRYSFAMPASNDWAWVGDYVWQVRLEDENGTALLSSEARPIAFLPDPNVPTPTPIVTPTAVPTLVPTTAPITPTPTPYIPIGTPFPTPLPPPIVVTATPSP